MENYKVYFGRLKNWFCDAFPFWFFFIGFALAICIPFLFQLNPIDHVYYTGFLLQFFAFLTIIIRINSLRKYLRNNQGFFGLTLELLKRLGSLLEKPKIHRIDVMGISKSSGSVDTIVISTDKPLEEKVADLEEKIKKFEDDLQETESKLNRRIDEIVSDIKKQIERLNNEINSIIELIFDKLKFEIVWSIWLILGLTVRSFSEMIGGWFM